MEKFSDRFRFTWPIRKLSNKSDGFEIFHGSEVPPKFVRERFLDARARLLQQRPEQKPPTGLNPDDLNPSPVGSKPPDSLGSSEQELEIEIL